MKKYNFITKEFLIREYIDKKKSMNQIALMINCSYTVIRDKLVKYNIKIRTLSEALRDNNNPNFGKYKYNITKQFLIKEYIQNKKPAMEIAKEIGCSLATIQNYLKRYKIPSRTISESMKGKLKGQNHWNYKNGDCLKKVHCIDCGRLLSKHAYYQGNIRCYKCKYKNPKRHPMFGKHHTEETKEKLRIEHLGKHSSPNTEFKKGQNKGRDNFMYGKIAKQGKGAYYKGIYMRSSYEIKFAFFLDLSSIKYEYEPKAFDLGNCTYRPDFYIPKWNLYIEIKGWWRDDAKKKFKQFRKLYLNKNIKVLMKPELEEMGVL